MDAAKMSIDICLDKQVVIHIHTIEYYSAMKRNETELVYEVDEPHRECHAEWSKSEKQILIHIYGL